MTRNQDSNFMTADQKNIYEGNIPGRSTSFDISLYL